MVPIITDITLTGLVRHNNTSTLITRKVRSNKRVNTRAAVALMPRMMSTMSVPIVTTNKVTSKHKFTTTVVLNTRTMRVKAHFIITGRSAIRRGCGRHIIGTGSVSDRIANVSANRPVHIVHGGVAHRCLGGRGRNTPFRRLRRVALKTLHGTIIRNSIVCNDIVTNRSTNLMGGRRAYTRVVQSIVDNTRGLLKRG